MSSTHRPVYGATWSHCTVIYGEDDCVGDPCKNEAFCLDKYDAYDCICRPGWSGESCSDEIMVEYTIHLVTSSLKDAETENAIFIQFIGTEGDMIKEQVLTSTGLGAFERSKKDVATGKDGCPNLTMKTEGNPDGNAGVLVKTITAQDVGELHKVTYRVAGDDSFKPSQLKVEHKGVMHAAVGELAASEHQTGVSIPMVRARKYTLDVNAVDTPEWAGTSDDVHLRLTGQDWEVSGEVVAVPGGLDDDVTCQVEFYGADVGTPAKITYWVNSASTDGEDVTDDFLPGLMMVDERYKAEITIGERCYGAQFLGNDEGRGYAFEDASCLADDTTGGCSGVVGCRTCAMWDPDADSSEVLCPWVLPFTDGRYIIVDLVDTQAVVTGMCTGNTESSEDVDCTGGDGTDTANTQNRGVAQAGTDAAACCEAVTQAPVVTSSATVTGMCTGNTASTEDVDCTGETTNTQNRGSAQAGTDAAACCEAPPVTGMCTGNTASTEDVDCTGETTNTQNRGATQAGTDAAACCEAPPVTGMCGGNTNSQEDVDCRGGGGTGAANTSNRGPTVAGTTAVACCTTASNVQ